VFRNTWVLTFVKEEGEADTLDELKKTVDFALKLGGEFADTRFETSKAGQISVVNGGIRSFSHSGRSGIAIRIKLGSAWGLASTTILDSESLKNTARRAFQLAHKSTRYSKERILLPEIKALKAQLKPRVKINHEDVDTKEKLEFVRTLDSAQAETDKRVVNRTSIYSEGIRNYKLVNSDGCELQWGEVRTLFSAMSVASEAGKLEFGGDNKTGTVGYELVKEADPNEFGHAVAKEAVEMLSAAKPPSGYITVVVDPDIAGLLAHEVMGHASEADEVVRQRSFLSNAVGKRVGTELVTMIDDGTAPQAYGSIPFDSEGTPSGKTVIIKNGVYKGFMHSLETAGQFNKKPTGNARAQDYNRRVFVRMTNTFFEPRDCKLEEIIGETKNGLLAVKTLSGMEDPVGGGFQARVLKGYLIKNGQRKSLVRSFTVTGKAIEILKTVDMVGKDFNLYGGTCGKGEEDWIPVSSGGPYMRAKMIVGGG
jgi:TldD protein